VTIMRMDAGLDTGPMLLRAAVAIDNRTTTASLHAALAALGARLITEALAQLEAGTLRETAQPADGVTYASKLSKDEARIDWTHGAAEIARRVRAFNPAPTAWSELEPGSASGAGAERVRILMAQAVEAAGAAAPGTILDGPALRVACGDGALDIEQIQWPGGRVLQAREALAARRLAGRRFT
jgi:methionyl-tRNA formyltransferase